MIAGGSLAMSLRSDTRHTSLLWLASLLTRAMLCQRLLCDGMNIISVEGLDMACILRHGIEYDLDHMVGVI